MKIETTEKFHLFRAEQDFNFFYNRFSSDFEDYNNQNIVVDLSDVEVNEEEIQGLSEFSDFMAANNLSFVVIAKNIDADQFEDIINVVPTLTEAEDIIEMDEISRDLGF